MKELSILTDQVKTKEDFVNFLVELRKDYLQNGEVWLLEQALNKKIPFSYIWGYDGIIVIADIKNALYNDVFYENLEGGNGNSSIDDSKTGHYSFVGNCTKQIDDLDDGTYSLNYRKKSGAQWILVSQHVVATGNSYTIDLVNNQYDNIRLYPKTARVISYTYEYLIGVTSITDPNNKTIYYEYDL